MAKYNSHFKLTCVAVSFHNSICFCIVTSNMKWIYLEAGYSDGWDIGDTGEREGHKGGGTGIWILIAWNDCIMGNLVNHVILKIRKKNLTNLYEHMHSNLWLVYQSHSDFLGNSIISQFWLYQKLTSTKILSCLNIVGTLNNNN